MIMISCQKHLELPVVLYLLTELFYIGRLSCRRTGVRSRDYQNLFGWMDYQIFFGMNLVYTKFKQRLESPICSRLTNFILSKIY